MTQRSLISTLLISGVILLSAAPVIGASPGAAGNQDTDAATGAGSAAAAGTASDADGGGLIDMNIFADLRDMVIGYTGEGGWVTGIQVFVVVFLALLLDFMQRRVLRGFRKRLERTRNPWDDALHDALTAPISLEIWVLGIAFAAAFVELETRVIHDIIALSLIVSVAWVLVRLSVTRGSGKLPP